MATGVPRAEQMGTALAPAWGWEGERLSFGWDDKASQASPRARFPLSPVLPSHPSVSSQG